MSGKITKEQVLEVLRFDPATGQFFWKVRTGRSIRGSEAGCVRKNGYRSLNINGQRYYCHRLAWLVTHGCMPKNSIDHIDGNRTNNRPGNLRDVTHLLNIHNQQKDRPNNTTGYKGVTWSKRYKKFIAQIMVNRKNFRLGCFDDPKLASEAYWKAKEHLGVFRQCV